MGWSVGEGKDGRDIGYGVPALCDHPDCSEQIDREAVARLALTSKEPR
jgi:hypothetical protein